jgi:DNA polymerase (family 10)
MSERRRVGAVLEEMATLSDLAGENPFKSRAFAAAARAIARLEPELASLAVRGELLAVPGIGRGIAAIIEDVLAGREPTALVELRQRVPATLPQLLALPGLGTRRARTLWLELGIESLGELEYACRENRLVSLAGFGAATQAKLLAAIEFQNRIADKHHLSTGWAAADEVRARLHELLPGCRAKVAGEVRRCLEIVSELVIVCAGATADEIAHALKGTLSGAGSVSETEVCGQHGSGIQVRAHVVNPSDFGAASVWLTGSSEHCVQLALEARRRGLSFADGRLRDGGRDLPCGDEDELYAQLDLPWIPPELREGRGEIEAARAHALPRLIEEADLRGAVHVHTTDSDGLASLAEMAAEAARLGWSYLGIADHSASAAYAHGLDAGRLRAQGDAIAAHNARGGTPLLLRGLEADILRDGALDLPEDATLDFVVASVHSSFRQDSDVQTERLCRAVARGRDVILGHPTGRLLLARPGYDVDLEAVLQAAAASGAAVEINAHPFRLDLDWRWVRRAVELGVPISIGPDAHDTEGLADVRWGVAVARKGWATARDVLNARPWPWWS